MNFKKIKKVMKNRNISIYRLSQMTNLHYISLINHLIWIITNMIIILKLGYYKLILYSI